MITHLITHTHNFLGGFLFFFFFWGGGFAFLVFNQLKLLLSITHTRFLDKEINQKLITHTKDFHHTINHTHTRFFWGFLFYSFFFFGV